jgi:hypothetical protein
VFGRLEDRRNRHEYFVGLIATRAARPFPRPLTRQAAAIQKEPPKVPMGPVGRVSRPGSEALQLGRGLAGRVALPGDELVGEAHHRGLGLVDDENPAGASRVVNGLVPVGGGSPGQPPAATRDRWPSLVRSRISWRSSSANTPRSCTMARPDAVDGSRGSSRATRVT